MTTEEQATQTEADEPQKIETTAQEKQAEKKTKTVKFARPPFASELFTPDVKRKYDSLPDWERRLIQQLISHGDLKLAAEEAGVARHARDTVDLVSAEQQTIAAALNAGGVTPAFLARRLADCLEGKCVKWDTHGNAIEWMDMRLVLSALRLVHELRGDFPSRSAEKPSAPDAELFKDIEP